MSDANTPSRYRSIILLLCRGWVVFCLAYSGWETLNYKGLFARLAEIQIGYFGSYAPLLTYFLLAAIGVIPAWLTLRHFRRKDLLARGFDTADAIELERVMSLRTVLRGFAIATSLTVFVLVGYATFRLPGADGRVQTIAASEAGSVSIVEGPARLVGGELGPVVVFGQNWTLGRDRTAFAPYLVASKRSNPAIMFVQLPVPDRATVSSFRQQPSWSGIIVEGGLPGTVRALLRSAGVSFGSPYYTLYASEYDLKIWYWLEAIQWALVTLFLLGCIWWLSGRAKRLQRQCESHQQTV